MVLLGDDWKIMPGVKPGREFSPDPILAAFPSTPSLTRMFECEEVSREPPGILPEEPENTA
ncbi:MAG TPA: hypothetical protein VL156_20660 [Terriglobales bacterium]|jgi:hypothetical protein|nr:hypothetical protein [Terriglobales bacterium]